MCHFKVDVVELCRGWKSAQPETHWSVEDFCVDAVFGGNDNGEIQTVNGLSAAATRSVCPSLRKPASVSVT